MKKAEIYHSAKDKTEEQARVYTETHKVPHRYLAYRDIPILLDRFVNGKKALDYGSGTGASTSFLHDLGFDVTGVDVSVEMLAKARLSFPSIQFCDIHKLNPAENLDFVFSSFVLFEIASKTDIIHYLNRAASFLKKNGIFLGITGSEHLYSTTRQWLTFDANFKENHKLCSGDIAKLLLKNPEMEFYDYYWTEKDYLDCFEKSNLKIQYIHYPLGVAQDSYPWIDELYYSPFAIFIAV